MDQAYRVAIIDSMNGMVDLAKPWGELLNESRSNSIFLTWEWLYSWAAGFVVGPRRLFILNVYEGDELIGIAPWCIRQTRRWGIQHRTIEFLGVPETGSDYLDVIAARGKEKAVAQQIYRFLFASTASWDSLALQDFSSDSFFLVHFLNRFDEDGKYVEIGPGSFCPSVALPADPAAFLAQLSPNRRQQFSRHLRLLERQGKVSCQTLRAGEVESGLNEFLMIYRQRWHGADDLCQFLERFVSMCGGKDWIQINFLTVNDRKVAGLLHLRYGKTLSMYLMAVDHTFDRSISIGNILVGLSIQRAVAEGFSVYDFLRGGEEYKFHWSNGGRRTLQLAYYGRKIASLLRLSEKLLKSIAKVLVR